MPHPRPLACNIVYIANIIHLIKGNIMFFQLINGWRIGEAFDAPRKPDPHVLSNGDFVTYEWAGEASQAREMYISELQNTLREKESVYETVDTLSFIEVTPQNAADLARRLLAGEFKSRGDVLAALNSPFVEVKEVY